MFVMLHTQLSYAHSLAAYIVYSESFFIKIVFILKSKTCKELKQHIFCLIVLEATHIIFWPFIEGILYFMQLSTRELLCENS